MATKSGYNKTKDELVFAIARELLKLEYCDYEFISNLQDKLIRLQASEIAKLRIENERYKKNKKNLKEN